jgi:hypothetical protein
MKITRNFGRKKYCLSTVFVHCRVERCEIIPNRPTGAFQKVGECLYRYSSNGVYYARIKVRGKEIRRSLGTIDRDLAKRRLSALKDEQSQIDRSKANLLSRIFATAILKRSNTQSPRVWSARRISCAGSGGTGRQVPTHRSAKLNHRTCNSGSLATILDLSPATSTSRA